MQTDHSQPTTIQRMLARNGKILTATSVSGKVTAFSPRALGGAVPWQESKTGPLPGARDHRSLPTLVLGRDVLPARCEHCGSRRLAVDDRANDGLDGRLVCTRPTCERQLAWVRQGGSTDRPQAKTLLPTQAEMPGVADFVTLRQCTYQCTQLSGHNPYVHENYGIQLERMAEAQRGSSNERVIRTGRLTVDLETERVSLSGRPCSVSDNSLRLLLHLARNVGIFCGPVPLTMAVTGRADGPNTHASGMVRNWVARLRKSLGTEAGFLIESIPNHGYRLAQVKPIEETEG